MLIGCIQYPFLLAPTYNYVGTSLHRDLLKSLTFFPSESIIKEARDQEQLCRKIPNQSQVNIVNSGVCPRKVILKKRFISNKPCLEIALKLLQQVFFTNSPDFILWFRMGRIWQKKVPFTQKQNIGSLNVFDAKKNKWVQLKILHVSFTFSVTVCNFGSWCAGISMSMSSLEM